MFGSSMMPCLVTGSQDLWRELNSCWTIRSIGETFNHEDYIRTGSMQIYLDDLTAIVPLMLGVCGGLLLLLFPYHLIRSLAKLARYYHQSFRVSDSTLDNRVQLPWSRYFQDDLTYSQFLREAVDHPKRFTLWSVFIRILGGSFALMCGAMLLLGLLARLTGVMK